MSVQPGATVTSDKVPLAGELDDPASPRWADIREYRVDLVIAPPVHPSVTLRYDADAAPVPLFFRLASDDTHFRVHLRWPDSSRNTDNAYDRFSDGAAVQFALSGGHQTSYMMGTPGAPVNIWYWRGGAGQAQNLAAAGFGSTTINDPQYVAVRSIYSEDNSGEWNVVFSRPLNSENEFQADLGGEDPALVSFAVWQGHEKQRDGQKHTSTGWIAIDKGKSL